MQRVEGKVALDEAPVWVAEDFALAVHRVGLEPVGKKIKINTALGPDVAVWHNAQTGKPRSNQREADDETG